MSSGCTKRASSWRSRFSSRIFSEYGSLATSGERALELVQGKDFDRLAAERRLCQRAEGICAAHRANPIKSRTAGLRPPARLQTRVYMVATRTHHQHGFGRTAARARASQFAAYFGKSGAHRFGARRIGQKRQHLRGDALGRAVFLDQLRNDAAAGNQIHHRDIVDLHESPPEAVASAGDSR